MSPFDIILSTSLSDMEIAATTGPINRRRNLQISPIHALEFEY